MDNETKEKVLDLLDEMGEEWKTIIINILQREDKLATGELIKSIDYALGEDAGKYFIELLAAEHYEYVNFGRLPGTWAPIAPLKKWALAKGLPENVAYPVRRKIFNEGIKAIPFIEEAITEIEKKFSDRLNGDEFIKIYEEEWERKLNTAFRTEQTKYKR